jgi:hypothetical protein
MTELMKRYEADFEKGLTPECYQSWLETEISDNKRYIATLESNIVMYKYEIKQLKAQLTWRPVSDELPSVEKDGDEIVGRLKDADEGLVQSGVVSTVWFIDNYESWFTHWLPIPPAPEGVIV